MLATVTQSGLIFMSLPSLFLLRVTGIKSRKINYSLILGNQGAWSKKINFEALLEMRKWKRHPVRKSHASQTLAFGHRIAAASSPASIIACYPPALENCVFSQGN